MTGSPWTLPASAGPVTSSCPRKETRYVTCRSDASALDLHPTLGGAHNKRWREHTCGAFQKLVPLLRDLVKVKIKKICTGSTRVFSPIFAAILLTLRGKFTYTKYSVLLNASAPLAVYWRYAPEHRSREYRSAGHSQSSSRVWGWKMAILDNLAETSAVLESSRPARFLSSNQPEPVFTEGACEIKM